jgi:hypothetical protein
LVPGYIKLLIVGYPYNFVPLLVFWLAIAPILVQLARRFSSVLIAIILVYQLTLLNLEYPGLLGFTFPNWAHLLKLPVLHYTLAVWGIYYPLGLIYSLNAKNITPWLQKNKVVLWAITGVFFVVGCLSKVEILKLRLAEYIYPLTFVLLLPTIKRDAIPWVRRLEEVGKPRAGSISHSTDRIGFGSRRGQGRAAQSAQLSDLADVASVHSGIGGSNCHHESYGAVACKRRIPLRLWIGQVESHRKRRVLYELPCRMGRLVAPAIERGEERENYVCSRRITCARLESAWEL